MFIMQIIRLWFVYFVVCGRDKGSVYMFNHNNDLVVFVVLSL